MSLKKLIFVLLLIAAPVAISAQVSVEQIFDRALVRLEQKDYNGAIKDATTSLTNALQAFGQKLYEAAARDTNAAGSSASGQEAGASANDEEIVDAEIVDDEK